jgi:hypothetical protein
MSDDDVRLSGNPNTLIAMAFVAALLAMGMSLWNTRRINDLTAVVVADKILSAQQQKAAGN